MKRITLCLMFCAMVSPSMAFRTFEMLLYPDGLPDSNGMSEPETLIDGRAYNVKVPTLTLYFPDEGTATGQCVVICPGGGYMFLSMESEGRMAAEWMAQRGITAAVLKYRMPNGHSEIPLRDALKAIETVRERSSEWGVNPGKVGIMGFSAGGHLAATASTLCTPDCRPGFSILIYPVTTMIGDTHAGSVRGLLGEDPSAETLERFSPAMQVGPGTPPAFLVHCQDDKGVPYEHSVNYFRALGRAGVGGCEMLTYPTGGHGWGFRGTQPWWDDFSAALERWIAGLK